MSRNIPPVRSWRVTYRRDGKIVASTIVDTINKRFAKWLANEKGYWPRIGDTVTVSLVQQREHVSWPRS